MTAPTDKAPEAKRGPGRPRKNTIPAAGPEPVVAAPVGQLEGPVRQLHGVDVVRVEPIAPLGPDRPMRIAKIFLADGRMVHGCRDCPDLLDFTGSRGDVMAHRNEVHGARYGKKRPKISAQQQELPEVLDAVLAPRTDGKPAPSSVYEMTMAEVIALLPSIKALGDLVESAETENDKLLDELNALRAFERQNRAKLDAFDELRDELVELRIQIRQWANYEAIKAEMYELKAWKKKVSARLKSVGFLLSDEEQ